MRVVTAAVIYTLITYSYAFAADQKVAGYSCTTIKLLVRTFGEDRALAWAKNHGYSQAQINAARRCLLSS